MDSITLKHAIEPCLENDKLGIKNQHDLIINLILRIKESATIAISSPYGCRKTFFAKCLENTLKNNKHKENINTLYIDLWANDYKNPLATFISAINEINEKNNNIKKLKKAAIKVFPILSFGLKMFTQILTEKMEELAKNILSGKDKEYINILKKELKEIAKNKKLVFLVDEIDRCQPKYAIETLEIIKHFFDIDNIIFILFINPNYICNIENNYIKYGIGNHDYIEKFIDKTIVLDIQPKKYIGLFSKVLNEKYKDNIDCISILCDFFSLSTRDVIQISTNIDVFFKFYSNFSPYRVNTDYDIFANRSLFMPLKEEYYYGLFYIFLMYTLKLKNYRAFKDITVNQNPNLL